MEYTIYSAGLSIRDCLRVRWAVSQPQYGQPGGNGGEPRQGHGEEEDVVEGEFHAV